MSLIMTKHKFSSVYRALTTREDITDFLASDRPMGEIFSLDVPIDPERAQRYCQLYQVVENTGVYQVNLPNNNLLRIKLEYTNNMGNSHYARYWIPYLFIAEAFGVITPGVTELLEVSSGSAGIALATACEALGFQLTLIVPEELPAARIEPVLKTGATLIRTPGYIQGCVDRFRKLLRTGHYFAPNHSEERSDFIVHVFSRIAIEYVQKYNAPDFAVIGIGNGTSTTAIFNYLRQKSTATRLHCYHPKTDGSQIVYGLYGQDLPMRHVEEARALADQIYFTNEVDLTPLRMGYQSDTEIRNMGFSSFYGLYYANLIAEFETGKTIMTIGYDKADRY